MMRLPTEKYRFILYKRLENSFEYSKQASIFFGSILSSHEVSQKRLSKGVMTGQTRLVIRTTNLLELKPQDKIVFDGEEYLVENIAFELANPMYLLSNRGRKCATPKVVSLC